MHLHNFSLGTGNRTYPDHRTHFHIVKAVVRVAADLRDAQRQRTLVAPQVPLQQRRLLSRQRRQHLRSVLL